jgi:phage tail sheath gpL-like
MSSTTLGYSVNGQFGIGIKRCEFSFEGNGTNNIDVNTIHGDMGLVSSIVHTGTGLYTLTLKDAFTRVLGISGVGVSTSTSTMAVNSLVISNEGTSTPISATLKASTVATAAAVDLPVAGRVFMTMVFQDNVTGGSVPR